MSTNRVSGMVSGMDTESLVQAYVSSYVAKKQKYEKAQTKLSWKQDAWKSLNTKVYSTYTKIGNMRYTTSYNLRKTTVSDATKATVTASSGAVNGSQSLKIKQLAKSGYLTGAQLAKNTTTSTKLSELGYTGGDTTIAVQVGGGQSKSISVSGDSSIDDVLSALKDAGVNASYDTTNRRIFVSAKESGTDNDFGLTATSDAGTSALNALGLLTSAAADKSAYATNASYALASDGQSYFVLDGDGNITYDKSGKAIVRAGATYDETATKQNVINILTNLANAYEDNSSKTAELKSLQIQINYSEATNAVNEVADGKNQEDMSKLIDLIKAQSDGAKYVGENNDYYTNYYVSSSGTVYTRLDGGSVDHETLGYSPKDIDAEITSLAKSLGIITEEDGADNKDTFNSLSENILKAYKIEKDLGDSVPEDYALSEEGITVAKASVDELNTAVETNNSFIADNKYFDQGSWTDYVNDLGQVDSGKISSLAKNYTDRITYGKQVTVGEIELEQSTGATRVSAQDAIIYLNDAEFTSNTNKFEVNGLTITATGVTGDDEISITTATDAQGIYDKIKDFLSAYNELVNELQSKYNATSASSYEPLTDDEKEEMSEKEIEKWETTIKDSLLRRDSTLGNLITSMSNSMMSGITINGRQYNLSSFGIQTLGYLNAAKNEQYSYHIYGDEEDDATASKEDKLMAMIESDPDTVASYFSQLASNLYNKVGDLMKSTTLSSTYTVYNDKEMASEYSNYTKLIKEWTSKIEDMEDRYYSQFSSMETQLAKLQNSTSSLSSLLGN